MIYVLYDKPKKLEDMSFLTAAFEKEYKEIYPEWRCTSIKQMLSVCSTTVKRTKPRRRIALQRGLLYA